MQGLFQTLWYVSVSVIEIFLLYYLFNKLDKRRGSKRIEFSGYLVLVAIDLMLNYYNIISDVKLIIIFFAMNIIMRILYHINLKKLLFLTTIFLLLLVLSEFCSFTILDLTNGINDVDLSENNLFLEVEGTLIAKSINLLLLIITDNVLMKRTSEISIHEMIITLLPCFTNIVVIFFIVDSADIFDVDNNNPSGFIVIWITVLLFLSSISLLLIFQKYLDGKEIQRKSQMMDQQAKDLMKYFAEKEIVDEKIRKIYHDIKNHVFCLEKLDVRPDSFKEYVAAIKDTIEGYDNYVKTGNKMLDILLNEKIIKMNHLNIKFSGVINLEKVGFIKDIDIITIFSNAVDNAMEACEKVEEHKRFIKINSAYVGNFFTISIRNGILDQLRNEGYKIRTNKSDKFFHGIGLGNIKNSVNKYKGEVCFDINDDEFKLIILIPIG